MADDIDIEEHDILQNPRFMNMLGSDIKAEPSEGAGDNDDDDSMEPLQYSDDVESESVRDVGAGLNTQESTKATKNGGKIVNNERVLEDSVVVLEDWSERLQNSPCYCKKCKTLFATRNAVDSHNMTAHSFLMAIDSPDSPEKAKDETKYCDHCKKYFNDTDFIQHLYDLLTERKNQKEKKRGDTESEVLVHSCSICFHLFENEKGINEHMLNNHETSPKTNNKVTFQAKCEICNEKTTSIHLHNEHIKTNHKEHYHKKHKKEVKSIQDTDSKKSVVTASKIIPQKALAIPKQPTKEYHYKCTSCKTLFVNPSSARFHNRSKHPEERTIVYTGPANKPEKTIQQYRSSLPKNVIFKCAKCPVHFLSCIVAIAHNIPNLCSSINIWTCPKCKKGFRAVDKELHELQHEASNKIRAFTYHNNLYARVACKCVECGVYFEERTFLKHRKEGCIGDTQAEHCDICDVKVSNYRRHLKKHKAKNLVKSDFIFIDEYLSPTTPNQESRKRKMPEQTYPHALKRPKTSLDGKTNTTNFYYCKLCCVLIKPNIYFYKTLISRRYHLSNCANKSSANHCDICGLLFSAGTPMESHKQDHLDKKMELKDTNIFCLFDLQLTTPQIPQFPTCSCGVQFLPAVRMANHKCDDPSFHCNICNQRFHDSAYKHHVKHHENFDRPVSDAKISEMINTFKMIKNIKYIIFTCNSCDLSYDSYDNVVEHCQYHLNNMYRELATQKCSGCSLKFEAFHFQKHRDLHLEGKINQFSLKIIKYDYKSLLTDCWFDIFSPLSELQVRQIMCQSLYASRFVKMTLILDGPPELTLYKCESCKSYVQPDSVSSHTRQCSGPCDTFSCPSCSIPFSSAHGLERHRTLHDIKQVSTNSYRIVSFNNNEDKDFNAKLQVHDSTGSKNNADVNVNEIDENEESHSSSGRASVLSRSSYKETLNKSENDSEEDSDIIAEASDNVNVPRISSRPRREVRKTLKASEASEQGEYHSNEESDVSSDLEDFVKSSKSKQYKVKDFYQCDLCKICLDDLLTLKIHKCVKEKLRQCSKCKFQSTHDNIKQHLKWHEQNKNILPKNINIVLVEHKELENESVKKYTFYKCSSCEVLVTNTDTHKCVMPDARLKCPMCKYYFSIAAYKSHLETHKANADLTRENIKILSLELKGGKVKADCNSEVEAKLLECSCGVHFNTIAAIETHLKVCSPDVVVASEECKKCGLLYSADLLEKHLCKLCSRGKSIHKNIPTVPLHRCDDCGCMFVSRNSLLDHVPSGTCNSINGSRCRYCGLIFHKRALDVHIKRHKKFSSMGRKYKIFKAHNKTAKLNIYKCVPCDMHFMSNVDFFNHTLRDASETSKCNVCGLKFHKATIGTHQDRHHSSSRNYQTGDFSIIILSKSHIQDSGDDSENQETLKEDELEKDKKMSFVYESVHYDNKLFKCSCGVCYTNINTYKGHRIKCKKGLFEKTRECLACGYLFCDRLLLKHLLVHHQLMNLSKNDFVVRCHSIKKEVILTIKPVQKAKLNRPFNTLFKCNPCDTHFLNERSVKRHLAFKNHEVGLPCQICDICGLRFTAHAIKKHMMLHHGKRKYFLKDFYIFAASLNDGAISKDVAKTEKSKKIDVGDENKSIEEYISQSNNETNDKLKKTSAKNPSSLNNKTNAPAQNDVMDVTPQSSNDDNSKNTNKIFNRDVYRCPKCNVHFLTLQTITWHIQRNHQIRTKIHKCICGLRISGLSLKAHRIMHHGAKTNFSLDDIKVKDMDISAHYDQDSDPRTLYKCVICDLHYIKSFTLVDHLNKGVHKKIGRVTCPECGLGFTKLSLTKHTKLHHGRHSLKLEDFIINTALVALKESASPAANKPSEQKESDRSDTDKQSSNSDTLRKTNDLRTLYKCVICDLHYIKSFTLVDHLNKGVHKKIGRVTCPECGLGFTKLSLTKHTRLHHGRKSFKLEDFIINTTLESAFSAANKPSEQKESDRSDTDKQSSNSETSRKTTSKELLVYESDAENESDISNGPVDTAVDSDNSDKSTADESDTEKPNDSEKEYQKKSNHEELKKTERIPVSGESNANMEKKSESEKGTCHLFKGNKKDSLSSKSSKHLETSINEVASVNIKKKNLNKLFKCGECNVHFLQSNACLKHVQNHKPMDAREYIECKLCNLQFRIVSFAKHIRIHHGEDFDLSKVLVEEYRLKEGQTLKKETFYAIDRVDSLVSTTTGDDKDNAEKDAQENCDSQINKSKTETGACVSIQEVAVETITLDSDDDSQEVGKVAEIKNEICEEWGEEIEADELDCVKSKTSKDGVRQQFKMSVIKQESPDKIYHCRYCTDSFSSNRAKEFHESLDHLDAATDCPICKMNFNASILNELHLNIKDEYFVCCACDCRFPVHMLYEHSYLHRSQNN